MIIAKYGDVVINEREIEIDIIGSIFKNMKESSFIYVKDGEQFLNIFIKIKPTKLTDTRRMRQSNINDMNLDINHSALDTDFESTRYILFVSSSRLIENGGYIKANKSTAICAKATKKSERTFLSWLTAIILTIDEIKKEKSIRKKTK